MNRARAQMTVKSLGSDEFGGFISLVFNVFNRLVLWKKVVASANPKRRRTCMFVSVEQGGCP